MKSEANVQYIIDPSRLNEYPIGITKLEILRLTPKRSRASRIFGYAASELADSLLGVKLRAGDSILMDSRTGLLLEKLPRPEVEELILEEVPDISYADVGGLDPPQ